MIRIGDSVFREVWLMDFEFSAPPGERPTVVCLVVWERSTGRRLRLWQDELQSMERPPYAVDKKAFLVAYYASAEMGCHLTLGWPLPVNVLDLFTEFRNATNGLTLPCGAGLLGALTWYGLGGIETAEKESMRLLAQRGGPWSESEKQALLDYCESDVAALDRLLPEMAPELDVPRALLWGRYMKAAARIEHNGIPTDTETLRRLRNQWETIQDRLIAGIDDHYGVYDGRRFKVARFANYLAARDIPWPQLPTGALDLKANTFREMARSHPAIAPLRELRVALSQMRLSEAVQYGMGAESLVQRIGQPVIYAREQLQLHRETYRVFWDWSDAAVDHAMLHGKLWTVFGWTVHTGTSPNPRFLRNFLMQGNGAEMLRLNCCLVVEQGIRVCAPVHDAILIEAPLEELDAAVERANALMSEASAIVLDGFHLRSDAEVFRYPERYMDERGSQMWRTVSQIIDRVEP